MANTIYNFVVRVINISIHDSVKNDSRHNVSTKKINAFGVLKFIVLHVTNAWF